MNAPADPHAPDPQFVDYLERDIARAARHQARFRQRYSFLGSATLPKLFALAAGMVFMLTLGLVWGVGTGFASAQKENATRPGPFPMSVVANTPMKEVLAALANTAPVPKPKVEMPVPPPLPQDVHAALQQKSDTLIRRARGPVHAGVAQLTREVAIGSDDAGDNYILGAIADMVVGKDGAIFVWDRSVPVIRKYDADGKFVRTIGRQGSGPGEYRNGSALAVARNGNLMMWDPGNARVNLYDPSGEPAGGWPTRAFGTGSAIGVGMMKTDTAGAIYLNTFITSRVNGKPGSGRSGWIRFNADGVLRDTIFTPVGPPSFTLRAETPDGNQFSERWVPFVGHPHTEISPLGYMVSGLSNRIALDIHEPGKPLVSIRRDVRAAPVSPQERDSARAEIMDNMRKLDPSWKWTGAEIPRSKPVYTSMIIGDDGRIWIEVAKGPAPPLKEGDLRRGQIMITEQRPGTTAAPRPGPKWQCPQEGWSRFEVYEPAGRFIGTVELPARMDPTVLRGDNVWGITCTDDEVPQVARYRIAWK
jgi:hypothetical protein